ncbi:putative membrane protein [Gottschalkia acidurici 9a]|uniref:Membrane protein n=1 Tax=Gottschalkia acidurici (strain ATCC 7906 / DSM 604 / BCRC 14475 / CIP 104303 / KCTC 5404 / NCIMB 10678 / 9a) TaxID=1128398 RepID=K0B1S7_GOTA9|nr:hypothetical protein [Gottschalkia acidurici]AFS78651.1 putative membrane protein [Gottschalkia acidurici 9a]
MRSFAKYVLASLLLSTALSILIAYYTNVIWYSNMNLVAKSTLMITPVMIVALYSITHGFFPLIIEFMNGNLKTKLLIISIIAILFKLKASGW